MECINTGCSIYHVCKIKEVAHHCIIHQKLILANNKDFFDEKKQMNLSGVQKEPEKEVDL